MGLKVWLPLNGDLHNQGCSNIIATGTNASINSSGKIGSCYSFSGNGYIKLNTAVLSNTTPAFSYCCWFKLNTVSANACLFSNRSEGSYTGFTIFYISGNHFYFDTGDRMDITIPITLQTGTWYHVAFTYKNNNGTLEKKIYLNGEMIRSGSGVTPTKGSPTMAFIGASQNSSTTVNTNYINGYLNDVRIYDHCLSAAEVREISQGLVLHYKLDSRNYNLLNNTKNFTADDWALTASRSTIPETGIIRLTPTSSAAYGKYKTNLNYTQYNNKTYTFSFDAQELPAANETYTSDYIRVYYGFSLASRLDETLSSSYDAYTYKNVAFKGEGWQHYYTTFSVSNDVLTTGKPEALVDGSILAIELGRRASKTPIEVKNIKLEIGNEDTGYYLSLSDYNLIAPIIEDSSGYQNNATLNDDLPIKNDSVRYERSALFGVYNTPSAIVNTPNFLASLDNCTVTWWEKSSVATDTLMFTGHDTSHYIAAGSSSKRLYDCKVGTPILYRDGIVETNHTTSTNNNYHNGIFRIQNEWHHFALVGTNLSTWTAFKINSYSSAWPLRGQLSDLRIYATALDADAIRQLYEVGAKVDNKNNVHSFELDEDGKNEITKRGQLKCSTFTEFAGMSYLKYDPNLYIEPDGSCWVRVYHHNNPASVLFAQTNTFANSVYIDIDRWFNVELANYLDKWEIMFKGKFTSDGTEWKVRWIQQYNPMTATYANVAVENITKITDGYDSTPSNFGGLYKRTYSSGNNTYLCANTNAESSWWGAVGSWTKHQSGIPGWGPSGTVTTTGFNDMYLRIDNVTFTSPIAKSTKNNIWTGNEIIEL